MGFGLEMSALILNSGWCYKNESLQACMLSTCPFFMNDIIHVFLVFKKPRIFVA